MQERKVGSVVLSKDPAIFSNSVDAILYVSLSDSFVIRVSTFSFSFCAIFLSSGGCGGAANGGRVVALVVFVAALPVVVVRLGLFHWRGGDGVRDRGGAEDRRCHGDLGEYVEMA